MDPEKTEEQIDSDGLDDLLEGTPAEPPKEEPEEHQTEDGKEPVQPEEEQEQKDQPADSDDEPKQESPDLQTEPPQEEEQEETQRKIKFRGQEYSQEDLIRDPKLLNDLVTAANQQTHYQELHGENKKRLEEMQAKIEEFNQFREMQVQQAEQARREAEALQQQQPQLTPQQLQQHWQPHLDKLAEDGWIEDDIAQLYPNFASGALTFREEVAQRLAQIEGALGQVSGVFQQAQEQQKVQAASSVMDRIKAHLTKISQEGEIFAPLADPEKQIEFLSQIRDRLNPPVELLLNNPDIMREYWVGSNHETVLASVAQAKQNSNATKQRQRSLAAGEGSSARPAAAAPRALPGEEEGWADL